MAGFTKHETPMEQSKDEWLTPPELLKKLGTFDLDPCAPVKWPKGFGTNIKRTYDIAGNGLNKDWKGRVWCNPPYDKTIGQWMERLADSRNGLGLIFARTDTKMWQELIFRRADAILFLAGRLHFYSVDGTPGENSAGAPSALIAFGQENVLTLRQSGLKGHLFHRDGGYVVGGKENMELSFN